MLEKQVNENNPRTKIIERACSDMKNASSFGEVRELLFVGLDVMTHESSLDKSVESALRKLRSYAARRSDELREVPL